MCYIWIVSFSNLGLAQLLCVRNQLDETVQHFFSTCSQVIILWTKIKLYFVNDIKLISLCPQTAILGYTNTNDRCFITQNLILLILKFYIHKSRVSGKSDNLSFSAFFYKLVKIKNLEKGKSLRNRRKLDVYEKKWSFEHKKKKMHANKTIL